MGIWKPGSSSSNPMWLRRKQTSADRGAPLTEHTALLSSGLYTASIAAGFLLLVHPASKTTRLRAHSATPARTATARSGKRFYPPPQHQPGGPCEILTPWRPVAPRLRDAPSCASSRLPLCCGRAGGLQLPGRAGPLAP